MSILRYSEHLQLCMVQKGLTHVLMKELFDHLTIIQFLNWKEIFLRTSINVKTKEQ